MKMLIHCAIAENLLIYIFFVTVASVSYNTARSEWMRFLVLGSWALLLALSAAALIRAPRTGAKGFLVAALGLVLGLLFPSL